MTYDSRPDTYAHSIRVGQLMMQCIKEALDRSLVHDLSKTEDPELAVFNEYTPKLKEASYGSEEYKAHLVGMGAGLRHHYAHNAHHPEYHIGGIKGMTLIDLLEMVCDWKAATERTANGDLAASLKIQKERFQISDDLMAVLENTAWRFDWLKTED